MRQSGVRINVDGRRWPARIFVFCLIVELSLVALDAFINYGDLIDVGRPIRRLFNITREDGLATWFMVIQTFVTGSVLWLIAVVMYCRGENPVSVFSWGILSGFFIYLSADDGAMIHERLGSTFKEVFRGSEHSANGGLLNQAQGLYPSYDWQLVVLPLLASVGLFMIYFMVRKFRDRKSRVTLLAAAGVMAMAVSLDFIEGLDSDHPLNPYGWIRSTFALSEYTVSHFAKSLEEFLEMFGITLLLVLSTKYLIKSVEPELTLVFDGVDELGGDDS